MNTDVIMKFVRAVLSRIWMLVIFALIGFIGAYVFASVTYVPFYTSNIKMMVVSSDSAQINVGQIGTFKSVISSYFNWLNTNDFCQSVADESGLGISAGEIAGMVTYNSEESSEVFTVTVKAGSIDTCKVVADSVETMIPRYLNGKYTSVALYVLESAGNPYVNSNNSVKTAIVGGLLGLVIAVVVAILWEVLDVRIKSENDLTKRYDYPILGTIPEFISTASMTKKSKNSYANAYAKAAAKQKAKKAEADNPDGKEAENSKEEK